LGNGSNQLIWENVRYGTLSNCILEDLSIISTDKMLISNGVTLRDVVNNTNIHNSQGNDRSLILEGSFTNLGTLQPNPTGYQLSVISFGNLVNHGTFKPSYITFSGSGDRFMSCDPEHPFSTHNNFYIDSTVGTIHAASDLYFSDIHQINAGDFDLQEPGRLAFSIHLSNLLVQSCTFLGGTVSSLYATNLVASNSSFQSLDLNGLISFRSGCSLTNVINHAILQNDSNNNYTLAVNGSFPNYGTLRNYPYSYNLTLDVYGNIQNYGTWTNHTTNLASTSLQSICFPQTNPCQTSYLNDTVLGSAVQAVGDIWFENCNLDLNLAVLFLDAAPSGIYIANGNLRDVDLRSVLANTIQMNAPHTITNVSFQSITNTGILTLDGDHTVTGDLINSGTIRNNSNSVRQLTVNGNLSNSGTIQNHPNAYSFTLTAKANITNTGIWTCLQTNLSGTSDQTISFPPAFPFGGSYLTDTVQSSAVIIRSGEDIRFNGTTIDLNGAQLIMPSGPRALIIRNGNLKEAAVQSSPQNLIDMNSGVIEYTSFTGITNLGTLTYNSNSTIYGDLLNLGIIQNNSNSDRILTVEGSINNQGSIRNFPGAYYLTLNSSGNINNIGIWSAQTLNLNGNSAQIISFPLDHAFLGSYATDNVSSSPVILGSDCYFSSCTFDLNNATLDLTQGGNWDIYMGSSTLRDVAVTCNSGSKITLANGGLLAYAGFQSIELSGLVTLSNSCFFYGDLLNNGIIQNQSNNNYTLEVFGDLTNNNMITNNPGGYKVILKLHQNLFNNGSINSETLFLSGSSAQHIHNSGSFSLDYLTSQVTSVPVYFHDNVSLSNTRMDFNNNQVYLNNRQGVTLSCSGGYLRRANLLGGSGATLQGAAGFYLEYVTSDLIELAGTITLYGNNFFGTVINHGTVVNGTNNNYIFSVAQLLDNRGTVTNNSSWQLYLHLARNLLNLGTITCAQVLINGITDQTILRGGTINPTSFYLVSNIGTANWFLNGAQSIYTGSQVAIPITNNSVLGTWKPQNTSSGAWGRNILISAGNDPEVPQNLRIEISGSNVILTWNESPYASSYRIYSSDSPNTGFAPEPGSVIEPCPGTEPSNSLCRSVPKGDSTA